MRFLLAVICFSFIVSASAQESPMLPLMPIPASVQYGSGSFPIDQSLRVSIQGSGDSRVPRAVDRFFKNLASRTGIPLRSTTGASKSNFVVTCAAAGEKVKPLTEDKSSGWETTWGAVRFDPPNPGVFLQGLQPFLQLVRLAPTGSAAPAVTIEDRPRFPWRGLLIDVSRHF